MYFCPMHKLFLVIVFLCFTVVLKSQGFPQNPMQGGMGMQGGGFDSSDVSRDSARVLIFSKDIIHHINPEKNQLNKSLDGFHRHHPVYRFQSFNSTLGNMGQTIYSLSQANKEAFGFQWGINPYRAYALSHHDADYYEAQSPFTEAFYALGTGQEQYFRVIHTQNINENWNIGLHYQKVNSIGLFSSQRTNHTAFRLFSSYFSDNKRYGLLISTSINDLKAQENAGVTALGDTLFRENIEQNRTIIPVALNGANNRSFQNGFAARHQYRISPDSTDFSLTVFQHLSYDFHRFSIEDNNRPEDFYPTVFNESITSTDHYHTQWNHEAGVNIALKKMFKDSSELSQQLSFSVGQELAETYIKFPVNGLSNDTSIFNNYFALNYQMLIGNRFVLTSNYKQMYVGANSGDFLFDNRAMLHLNKQIALIGELNIQNREQFYFYNSFVGNHNIWVNNFSKSQQVFFKAAIWLKKLNLKLSVSQNTITNPVVLNENIQPIQFSEAVNVTVAELLWNARLKNLYFENQVQFQSVNGSDALRLPNFFGRSGFYFRGYLKKKTEVRIGTDVFFISGFQAMNYVPYLGNFALQNDFSSNNIVIADVYLSANIKRARFFAKIEHVNQGLDGFDYFISKTFPLTDRVFKLGLSWLFFD